MQNNYINNSFDYFYNNAASGAVYACVITNQANFDQFPLSYPPSQYFDSVNNGWNPTSTIGKTFELVRDYFVNVIHKTDEEATELAQAFVIGEYKLGMGISKKDSNGNFQPIFVEEISTNIPTGNPLFPFITIKTYQQTPNCNLK